MTPKNRVNRALSLMLALCMLFALLPEAVPAAGEEETLISERVNSAPELPVTSPEYYTFTEHQIRFLDQIGSHNQGSTVQKYVEITHPNDVSRPDTVTVTGTPGDMKYPVGDRRYFTVLTAMDTFTNLENDTTIHKWVDIVIDTTTSSSPEWIRYYGMDVYLVGFGGTVTADNGDDHPTKGIWNITVKGDHNNVYLVDCNVGAVKNRIYDRYDLANPWSFDNSQSVISVSGVDSHVYMDKDTNAIVAGRVGCRVQVSGDLPADTHYDPVQGAVVNDSSNGAVGTPDRLRSTVELSNVRICQLGSDFQHSFGSSGYPNGVLDGCSGVTLNNCSWGPAYAYDGSFSIPLNQISLNGFAKLTLVGVSPVKSYGETEDDYDDEYAPIELNHLSSLVLSGEIRNFVTAKGRNTLFMKDAALQGSQGKILVDGECNANTDAYVTESELYHVTHYPADSGAKLELMLAGDSTIMTEGNNGVFSPDIMVDHLGALTIRDDPDEAGIGSLTIGSEWSDGGHSFCAAIGGTASLYPEPHGPVYMRSGVLTAYSSYGGAAIGGSVNVPWIAYQEVEGGEGHYLAWNGNVADLIKIYQSPTVGYLYYDTKDDRFNPSRGGYWLQKTSETTYVPVEKDSEGHLQPVWIETEYVLDEQGNRIVDPDNSIPGYSRDGGEFSVSGGVVNAKAYLGAAIGGAAYGNGGRFGITGGTVNAVSGGGSAAIGGGAVNWGQPVRVGIGFRTRHDWTGTPSSTWTDGIYVDGYTYSPTMGGGSGHLYIYGGVVNAASDNLAYDESGNPVAQAIYYDADGTRFYPDETDVYYTYTDQEYVFSFADGVRTGRLPGYVIGSACENANAYYENVTEILRVGGIDSNPVLILRQNKTTSYGSTVNVSWNSFFRAQNPEGVMTRDALGRDPNPDDLYNDPLFDPSLVTEASIILGFGWEDDGYTAEPLVLKENYPYTYRVRGQMNLPDLEYGQDGDGVYTLILPAGTALDLLPGSVVNVPERFAIMAADMSQFVIEEGAVVQGKGRWPGKPPEPASAPSSAQVRSLLSLFQNDPGGDPDAPTVVTHLGIVETSDGKMVLPGNGAEAIKDRANALGLSALTIFSAGSDGLRGETVAGVTTWRLNSRSADTVISLLENGALTATPGKHTNYDPDIIVRDDNAGGVSITLQSVKLHTPEYTVYRPYGTDDQLTLVPEPSGSSMAFKISFTDEQVVNNEAVFSVPSFAESEFSLSSVAPLRDKCAVRYGGKLSFTTPFADFGNITINQLQLKYGNGTEITGIEGGGSVNVPSIAGFPVSGGASMKLNTFAPKRLISLSVDLETPIFSGAFQTAFKEVRGIIMLDTLYAELAVEDGGIPLVPPTVIGYLQGGGLGISGLADTVGMDSFGAPPVRLNVAAKGSIVDVIEGWIRLSVGLDGFDLSMTDIKVANMKFIKELGVSAKWDAGERVIHGKQYWGLSADMSQYMVIAIPATVSSFYGGEDDTLPLLFSATGTIGFGGFAGYYEENGWIYFIYQLHASGNLKGSITIPKKLVGGVFPFKSVNLGNTEIGFYAAANATSKVNAGSVSGSPAAVLRSLASNAKLDFDAAVGAKLVIGTGAFRFYLRAVYVFGEKAPRLSAGYGEGSDLDLSGISNLSAAKGASYAMVGELKDPESGEMIPAVVEMAAENLATLKMGNRSQIMAAEYGEDEPGVTLTRTRAVNSFNAEVAGAVVGSTFLAITLSDPDRILSAGELTVYRNGTPVTLVTATYDDDGSQTNTANFFADAGVAYFAPDAAGSYTVSSAADIDSVDVIRTTVFATLNENGTTLGSACADYQLQDADPDSKYKVQLVLGKAEGDGDYLLAETEELTGSDAFSGAISFSLTGSLAPTGDYYPSILLTEYIDAEGENGQTVKTWALVDRKSYSETVHYTNDMIPSAPESVSLVYSGNGTMTAGWTAAQGVNADAYQIAVYDAAGGDTGLRFRTGDASTSLIMDLSSLEAGQNYSVGVKALIYDDASDRINSTYQLSYEGMSAPAELNAAVRPAVTYSDNVTLGEGSSHTMSVSADGGAFTVSGESALNFTVTDIGTGTVLAGGNAARSLSCDVPAQGADARPLILQILAVDPVTLDYVLDRITVSYDTIAPPLVLNDLGAYALSFAENGYVANVTGHAEAGASVLVYQKEYSWADDYTDFIAGTTVGEDGSFSIPVLFGSKPEEDDVYCVVATDAAGNASAPMSICFRESEITVNFAPDSDGAVCSIGAVGIASGASLGTLPVPYLSDGSKLFDGWYYQDADGNEVDVSASTVFTSDVTLYARWAPSVTVKLYEGSALVAEFPVKAGRPVGSMPAPRIVYEDRTFIGWYTSENGGSLVTGETVFNADATLHARWSSYVTVTFDAGQGSVDVSELRLPTSGTLKIAEYPTPSATGYTFDGWYYSDDGDGEIDVDPDTVYSADTTLIARWIRNTDTTSLLVTQAGCAEDEVLPDPVVTLPELSEDEEWTGATAISYAGTGSTGYMSASKPTEPGTYKVIAQRNTFETAYVGSAEFTITPVNAVPAYGDVNGDGNIDTVDLTLLRQYLADASTSVDTNAADVNGSGGIDTVDLTLIRQYLADNSVVLGPGA